MCLLDGVLGQEERASELCKNCSGVTLSPQLSNHCADTAGPASFTFFFFNLEDNKIVITYPFRATGKGRSYL